MLIDSFVSSLNKQKFKFNRNCRVFTKNNKKKKKNQFSKFNFGPAEHSANIQKKKNKLNKFRKKNKINSLQPETFDTIKRAPLV